MLKWQHLGYLRMLNILELRKRLVRTAKARQGQFDKGLNMVPSSIRIAGGLSWASVQPLSFSFKKLRASIRTQFRMQCVAVSGKSNKSWFRTSTRDSWSRVQWLVPYLLWPGFWMWRRSQGLERVFPLARTSTGTFVSRSDSCMEAVLDSSPGKIQCKAPLGNPLLVPYVWTPSDSKLEIVPLGGWRMWQRQPKSVKAMRRRGVRTCALRRSVLWPDCEWLLT